MNEDRQHPEVGVEYRSGPMAWTDVQRGRGLVCAVYEEVLLFDEKTVSRRFDVIDHSRAIGRQEVSELYCKNSVSVYGVDEGGVIEIEFSDAKYTGVGCREGAAGCIAFHVYHRESGLTYGHAFRQRPADLDRVFFDALWRSIDETHGVAEVRRFLACGDVNAKHPNGGSTLLHLASGRRNFDLIRFLVERGANLEARDSSGTTPLHLAVLFGDIDMADQDDGDWSDLTFETTRLLLSLGSDAQARDNKGQTPRDWAADYGTDVLEQFDRETKEWT